MTLKTPAVIDKLIPLHNPLDWSLGWMELNNKSLVLPLVLLSVVASSGTLVYADAVSPRIKQTDKVYSKEEANKPYYGAGLGGRETEAMDLRFQAERAFQDGRLDIAIPKAYKAVQLDQADPGTHLLLARILTKKLYTMKGEVDKDLLQACMYEWGMLWHHDADWFEQSEAKAQFMALQHIQKELARQKRVHAKLIAEGKDGTKKTVEANEEPRPWADNKGDEPNEAMELAQRKEKKRFLLF